MASLSINDDSNDMNDDFNPSESNDSNSPRDDNKSDVLNDVPFSNAMFMQEWGERKVNVLFIISQYEDILNDDDFKNTGDIKIIKFFEFKIDCFKKIVNFIDEHYQFLFDKKNDEQSSHFHTIYLLQSYIDTIIEKLHECDITNLHVTFPLRLALRNEQDGFISDEIWRMCVIYEDNPDDHSRFIVRIISIQAMQGTCIIDFDKRIGKSKDEITIHDLKIDRKNYRTFFSSHLTSIHDWASDYQKLYRVAPITNANAVFADPSVTPLRNTTLDIQTYIFHGFYDKFNNKRQIGGFETLLKNNKKHSINMFKMNKNICLLDYVNNSKLYEKYMSRRDEVGDLSISHINKTMETKRLILTLQTTYSVANTHRKRFMERIEEICRKIKAINEEEHRISEKAINDNEELSQMLEGMSLGKKETAPANVMAMLQSEIPMTGSSSSSSSSSSSCSSSSSQQQLQDDD